MQKTAQGHSIVWVLHKEDSEIARQFDVPGDMILPYFVNEDDSSRLEHGEAFDVGEFNLLLGLLVEYFTPPPMSATHKIKPYFKDVLTELLEQFRFMRGYNSIEQCIMVLCAYLKEENGESVSHRALRVGLDIIPESLRIKSALSQAELI